MVKPSRHETRTDNERVLQVEILPEPRKAPRQARSIALVSALKQTGRMILERDGREALTALAVAEHAGVAVSSIYEYFPTIEALIAAIFEDYRAEARADLLARIAALPESATLYDGLLLSLRAGLAYHYRKSQLDPAFSVRSTHFDELVRLDMVKAKQFWDACVTPALMQRFASEVRVRDLEKAQFLVFQTLLTLPRVLLLERPEYLKDDDTARMIARMVHALLTTPE